jgi:hypothetical protein
MNCKCNTHYPPFWCKPLYNILRGGLWALLAVRASSAASPLSPLARSTHGRAGRRVVQNVSKNATNETTPARYLGVQNLVA